LNDANVAIQSRPSNWRAWDTKGSILASMRRFDEAEESYQNALGSAPAVDKPKILASQAQLRARRNETLSTAPSPSISSVQTRPAQRPDDAQELPGTSSYTGTAASPSSSGQDQAPAPRPAVTTPPQQPVPTAQRQPPSGSGLTSPELDALNADTPAEPPPTYTPASNPASNTSPTATNTTVVDNLAQQLGNILLGTYGGTYGGAYGGTTLSNAMTAQNKGKLSMRAYTAEGSVDAVQLLYVGLTSGQLTGRELDTSPKSVHPSHGKCLLCVQRALLQT